MAPLSSGNPPLVPAATARQLLLAAQGLLDDPGRRATAAGLYELVERLGFVQIDSINVVERAHHLTLASRLDGYRPPMLTRLLERERSLFEHWTHDAAAIPTRWFPHWRIRFERRQQSGASHAWWHERLGPDPEGVMARVYERIEREGPLTTRDFEQDGKEGESRSGSTGWWGWKPEKAALEQLWRTGRLAIRGRINFSKVYDLTERVLPAAAALPAPEEAAHLDWACRTALARLGIASAGEIARFWAAVSPIEVKAWCEASAAQGEIEAVLAEAVDGSRPRLAWAVADWRERAATAPEPPPRLRLLSPFDPILRERRRALRLFGFDYRFEAFVPADKRLFGYYVLPLLEGDRLVGRAEPKFDRERGVLEIRDLWWEPGVRPGSGRRARLEAAVARLARTIGAESFTLPAS